MSDNNIPYEYKNKIYKTKASALAAQTRDRKKKIKRLEALEKTQEVEDKIRDIKDKIANDKSKRETERKEVAKQKRLLQKLGFPNYIETTQTKKTQKQRIKDRNKKKQKLEKQLKDVNFQTKQLDDRKTYHRKALGGRITENYLKVSLDDYEVRNNIIRAKLSLDVMKAQKKGLKLLTTLTLEFIVKNLTNDREEVRYASSIVFNINTVNDIDNLINDLMKSFILVLDQVKNASNLVFVGFKQLKIISTRQTKKEYKKAGNYIELNDEIKKSKGVMNIKNLDERCLEYCLIAFRYNNQIKSKDTSNPKIYKKYFDFIKIPENQQYPINIEEDIPKYERLNDIRIIVYVIKNKQFIPYFKTNYRTKETLHLLLIEDGDNNHLCLIRNVSRLSNHLSKRKNSIYYCENCHNYNTRSKEQLEKHINICNNNEHSFIKLPIKGKNDIMKFINSQNEFQHPYSCFVDFESTLKNVDKRDDQKEKDENSNTQYYQKHIPNSFGLKYQCIHNEYSDNYKSYVKDDPELLQKTFIEDLEKLAQKSYDLTQKNKTVINWKPKEFITHKNNKQCENCKGEYDKKNYKVAHHNHITGEFIGSYCNSCNLKYQYKKFIPVYIHNLKGYDSHLFIKSLYYYGCQENKLSCIPNNEENYISFSKSIKVDEYTDKDGKVKPVFFEIRFIDTYAILSGSLDSLVENLKVGVDDINQLRKLFKNTSDAFDNDNDFKMMIQKGVYPYEYIDDFKKLLEKQLPSKKQFYSKFNFRDIHTRDYDRAIQVFNHFKCKSILDYHELYLKADVLLLSDVWNNFKTVCLTNYKLDPTYYYTAPGLSWDAFLKISKIELELITDYEMYLFVEEGIRGGLSQISKRFSQANNPYMKNYDKTKPDKYISYLDANNLYGWAMCEYLPYKNFKWNTEEWNTNKILKLDDKADKGYLFNVDLKIPEDKHNYFNNYTPLPLNKTIKKDELNDNQIKDYKETNIKKLCCSLEDRTNYKVNYRLLKLVLSLGFELVKVNQVLEYEQKPFMKDYIMLNTELRKKAKTDFEKDFFKLMNNSCYGKTMENVRNRIEFSLISNEEQLDKLNRLKKITIFDENLVGVHKAKYSVKLNKPIYMGQNILDDSKVLMNDFHYNFMMKKIKPENLDLLFTDTDSLAYEIRNQDIYKIMKDNKDEFDLSNFKNDMYDESNKKVIGKFKDESAESPITEFVGHKSKVYSYLTDNDYNSKKNKGIKKCVMDKFITHQDYKDCLFNKEDKYITQNTFRSYKHTIYTIKQKKKALCYTDDKVYICDDNIHTYSHGHYKNKK